MASRSLFNVALKSKSKAASTSLTKAQRENYKHLESDLVFYPTTESLI